MTRFLTRLGLLGLAAAAGCGATAPDVAVNDDPRRFELAQVNELFTLHQADKKRPPARLADLQRYAGGADAGFAALRDGRCVAVWGVPPADAGAGLLAYEKAAPTDGGWVLLQTGEVKRLSAADVQAATRAGR